MIFFFTLSCKTERRFVTGAAPNVRESKTVLDSRFHAVDSGFQVLDIELFVRGTWIPDANRWWDPDSLSVIPEAQDSVFHKQKFPDSAIRIPYEGRFFLFLTAVGRHSLRAKTCNCLSSPISARDD